VGLSYSMGIPVKGQGCHLADSQNGNIITLSVHIPHFLIHSSVDGHLGYFPSIDTVNSAAINMGMQISLL
jgi:hypothetical protein